MYDLSTQARISTLRSKAVANTLTPEDILEAVQLLAGGRKSAAVASTSARTTRAKSAAAAAPGPSGDDLLDEMLGDL